MSKKNKIKYNLKNAHYAKLTVDEDGSISYETPVPLPGSVSISLDAQGEISSFYADGIVYYKSVSNNGYEGDFELALLPESFRTDILGEILDSNKVMIENADAKPSAFALLFEFDGDVNSIRHVLYNCSANRPSISSQTKEDTIEPVTDTLSLSATPLADGRVKAKTSNDTTSDTYKKWYEKVYESESTNPVSMGE